MLGIHGCFDIVCRTDVRKHSNQILIYHTRKNDRRCVVSGWGQTSFTTNDAPTSPQKQVYVSIVNYMTCRASFANTNLLGTNVDTYLDPNGEICAGGQSMRDACTVIDNKIIFITKSM